MNNKLDPLQGGSEFLKRKSERISSPSGPTPAASRQDSPNKALGDQVSLSDRARRLRDMEQHLAQLPIENTGKVDAIRQDLIHGRYHINAERIVDKLLTLERLLDGTRNG